VSKKSNKGLNEVISGFTMMAVFGGLWLFMDWNLWLIPFVFAGLLPVIRGLGLVINRRTSARERRFLEQRKTAYIERQILRAAKKSKGILTPAEVALGTSLSIEEAERQLQRFAEKGYAGMDVTEDGRIIYRFPEFLPENRNE
jgi:hypothetical protein